MNFIKNNRNKFVAVLSLVIVIGLLTIASSFDKDKVIFEDLRNEKSDTVSSQWYYIGSSPHVALSLAVSDSVSAKCEIFWKAGNDERVTLATIDTMGAGTKTGASPVIVGKPLRGYGAHNPGANGGDTNLIPGANYIKVKITCNDAGTDSSATNYVRVRVLTAD